MWADLHCHSRYSDGSQTIPELIRLAKERGLDALGITDHDTAAGQAEALEEGLRRGVKIITAIEISAWDRKKGRKIHLLGYGFTPRAPRITELCAPLLKARHENTLRQIKILEEAGYPVTLAEVREEAAGAPTFYKQHIMAVLVKKGLAGHIYAPLYKTLFKGNGICQGDIDYLDVYDALEAVKADGGRAVLAHPGQQDSFYLIPELAKKGLWGLELHHEDNDIRDRIRIKALAGEYNLALTGGSDFHGEYGSEHGIGDIVAPKSFFWPDITVVKPGRRMVTRSEPKRMTLAQDALWEAGSALRAAFDQQTDKGETLKNGDHADLLTRFDREIEELLVDRISEAFPRDLLITEEEDRGTQPGEGIVWIIDPIDGTTNFVQKHRDFSISVGCYRQGEAWFGLVYDVMAGELYSAVKGEGAKKNGIPMTPRATKAGLGQSLIDFSIHTAYLMKHDFGVDMSELAPMIRGHRAFGSASLILCRMALGETQVYISAKLCLWDYAAAGLILREQGGDFLLGRPIKPDAGVRSGRFFLAWTDESVGCEMKKFLKDRGWEKL